MNQPITKTVKMQKAPFLRITTQNSPFQSLSKTDIFLKSTNHSFPAAKQMCLRSKLLFQSLELSDLPNLLIL